MLTMNCPRCGKALESDLRRHPERELTTSYETKDHW